MIRFVPSALLLPVLLLLASGCNKPADGSSATPQVPTVPTDTSSSVPTEIVTKSGVEMVHLPGGTFSMGNDRGNPDEAPAHRVTVSAFAMDRFEVTHAMYAKVQLPDPSHWRDNPKGPVERVRWRDAKQYCNERSLLEGLKPCYNEKTPDWDCDFAANGYRLPTEAEWEYASLCGNPGPFEFGTADKLRQNGWFGENAEQMTHATGQKKPNKWGIHDLYGNVSEWCEDVYGPAYYKTSPAVDPTGPPSPGGDVQRVIRGGSWKSAPDQCRSAARQGERTGDSDACFSTDYCGFRCVRRLSPAEVAAARVPSK